MNVRFVEPAYTQLAAILAELAANNPQAASRFSARVDRAIGYLAQFPDAYQQLEDMPDLRPVPLRPYPYLMFYQVMTDEVVVVALAHGVRKDPAEGL
jgi:toxin ParE1/3/4